MAIDEKNTKNGEKEELSMTGLIKKLDAQFDSDKAEAEKRAMSTMEVAAVMDEQINAAADAESKSENDTDVIKSLYKEYMKSEESPKQSETSEEETKEENIAKEAEAIISLLIPDNPGTDAPDDLSDLPVTGDAKENEISESEEEPDGENAEETAEEIAGTADEEIPEAPAPKITEEALKNESEEPAEEPEETEPVSEKEETDGIVSTEDLLRIAYEEKAEAKSDSAEEESETVPAEAKEAGAAAGQSAENGENADSFFAEAQKEDSFDTLDVTGTYEIDDSFDPESEVYSGEEPEEEDALGRTLFDVLENIARDEAYEMAEEVAAIKAHNNSARKKYASAAVQKTAEEEEPVSYTSTEMMHSFEPAAFETQGDDEKSETGERRAVDTEIMKTFGLDPRLIEKKGNPRRLVDVDTESELGSEEEYDDLPDDSGSLHVTDETYLSDDESDEVSKKRAKPVPRFEYSDPNQNPDIFASFKKKYGLCKFRLVMTALLTAALLGIENIPAVFEKLGMVNFILVDFAVCFLCAFFSADRIVAGFRSVFTGKVDADAFTSVSLIGTVASILAALGVDTYTEIRLYNFSFALCVLFSVYSMFIRLKKDIFTFNIASSKKKKLVLSNAVREESVAERSAFNAYISDSSDVRSIKTASFIEDFYARREEYPRAKKCLRVLLPVSVALAIAALIVSRFVLHLSGFESISNLYVTLMICSPLSAFLSFSYSGYLGAIRAYSYNAALIGDLTPDEYENTSVISVPDDVAFPADKVRIRGVKVYENASIEKVLHYASAVYSKLGGPLATAFKTAALDGDRANNVEIRSLEEFGVDAAVDGRIVVIGQPSYMDAQCYSTTYDRGDDLYEGNSNKRILYLALDNRVIAKFYIQYNSTSDFVYIVRHLAEEKICTSIQSADPGIDNDLLAKAKLDPAVFPVKIMKPILPEEELERSSAYDGSIVSTGDAKGLAKALMTSRKLLHITKTNLAIKIISMVIGAALMGLVLFTGHSEGIRPFYPALYQLFWMIPMWLVSKIYI